MSTIPLQEWLDIATQAAQRGGSILKKLWGNLHEVREKGYPGDLVTEADRQSEEVVLDWISSHFPDHQILSEESGLLHPEPSEFTWAVDPVDGTTNYAHCYPMAAVSIGLMQNGEPILGVIYNPFTDELYQGAKGLGATLNHRPIHASSTRELSQSLLATGFAYDRAETKDNNYAEFCHLTNITQGVRRAGAASLDLAYVACGRVDGYWERGIKPWDIAAGIIILREAGGTVSAYNLDDLDMSSGRILASNGHLHEAMSRELAKAKS